MAITLQDNPKFLAVDENGSPRVGAKLFTYEPGTTTKKATYTLSDLSASNTNPIVLNSNGEATIWLNGAYKFVLAPSTDTDPPASPYWTVDDIGTAAASAVVTESLLNGSFESEDSIPGTPDNWTLTGTWVLESSSNLHKGAKHLKATGTGSNTATSAFFEVTPGIQENLAWSQKTSNGTNNVKVDVDFYTNAQVYASTTTLFNAAGSATWENKSYPFTVPAGAGYAKVKVTGTVAAATLLHIDNFVLSDLQFLAGTATVAGSWYFSGQLTEALGSAATPSYSFTGDTNTGVWSPAADTWAVSTGGTEHLRITSVGNLILESTAPAAHSSFVHMRFGNSGYFMASRGTSGAYYTNNQYYDGTWRSLYNAISSRIAMDSNGITLLTAGAVSADSAVTDVTVLVAKTSGQVDIPVATGTAPLNVTSTTVNTNLNADMVDGYHAGNGSSAIPISNGTVNTNLNADMVDGYNASTSATASNVVVRDASAYITASPSVSGFVSGVQTYIDADPGASAGLTIDTIIGAAWESVGPTGSGATNIWSDMDNIPSSSVAVILKVYTSMQGDVTSNTGAAILYGRNTGSSAAANVQTEIGRITGRRNATEDFYSTVTTAYLPIDSSRRFDLQFLATPSATYAKCVIYLVGFIR